MGPGKSWTTWTFSNKLQYATDEPRRGHAASMFEFIKNRIDAIVPAVLLIFSFAFLSYNALGTEKRTLNPFARAMVSLISHPQTLIMNSIHSVKNLGDRYVFLTGVERENEALKKQLEKLNGEASRLMERATENKRLRKLLKFKEIYPASFMAASVIGIGSSLEMRYITIDRGAKHGVMSGLVVVTDEGVVGRTIGNGGTSRAPALASLVLLLLDRRSAIDAIVQRSRARGVLRGNGYSLRLDYLDVKDDVKVGDTVISSGMGGVFPKGLILGLVTGDRTSSGGINYHAKVTSLVDLNHLEEVLVILKGPDEL